APRERDPERAAEAEVLLVVRGVVVAPVADEPERAREVAEDGREVEVTVRDVEEERSVRGEAREVSPLEGLARHEVERDRVAREGVEREHVEGLRRAREREARVAEDDAHL